MNKIIEWGIYILVFLLPLQTRYILISGSLNDGYWEYGTVSIYLTDILLIVLLTIGLLSTFRRIKRAKEIDLMWYALATFEAAVFFSMIFSLNHLLSLIAYIRLLLGFGVFWLASRMSYSKKKFGFALAGSAVVQALLGIWQFVSQSSFANKWLGIAIHNPSTLGTSVVELARGGRWLRAYGGLDHPNMLGGYLAISIIVILLTVNNSSSKKVRNIHYFVYTVLSVALFYTFSRSAWLALFVGITANVILRFKKVKFKNNGYHISAIILATLALLAVVNFDLVRTRLSGEARLEQLSNHERLESFATAGRIFNNNWMWGVGPGNYSLAFSRIEPNHDPWVYQPVHNVIALLASEVGLFGILAFLFIFFVFIYRQICKNNKIVNIIPVLMFLILFMFDHWLWSSHFGLLFFYLILGFSYKNVLDFE